MSWLSRRSTDEMHAQARRRLDALARRSARPEAPLTDPEDPEDPEGRAEPSPSDGLTPAGPLERITARLPTTVRDGRVAISRTAAMGLAFLALLAVVLAGSYAWRGRAVQAVLPAAPASRAAPDRSEPASADPAATAPPSPAGEVVVDVAGKVRQPGVVRLPLGSRVVDAIAAAGGVRGDVDLTALNLARVLTDGEQVVVGAVGAPAPSAPPATGQGGSTDTVVNLNTATLEQLDTLPGVGPVLAQRILDWRTAHGRFSTIDELREVSGIGDSRFTDLAPRVRV
jgi:competence protein ComEA